MFTSQVNITEDFIWPADPLWCLYFLRSITVPVFPKEVKEGPPAARTDGRFLTIHAREYPDLLRKITYSSCCVADRGVLQRVIKSASKCQTLREFTASLPLETPQRRHPPEVPQPCSIHYTAVRSVKGTGPCIPTLSDSETASSPELLAS